MRLLISILAAAAVIGAGSAFASSQQPPSANAAASDQALVKELRAIRKELRTLNGSIGSRYRDAPVITQLSDLKSIQQRMCSNALGLHYPDQC